MSFRNHKHFADAQGRIRDLSLVISRRPWLLQSIPFKKAVDVASNGERFTLAANLKTYIPSKINNKKKKV
jgi:hypothetical protein